MKHHIDIQPGEGGKGTQLPAPFQAKLYLEHSKRPALRASLTTSVG